MPHNIRYLSVSLMVLAVLSACGERAESSDALDQAALSDPAAPDVNQALTPGLPDLIPPAPGELGGLPDDRRPLDESPIDPASIRGAGLTLQKYALALESKDYDAAYALWRGGGEASGLSKEKFAEAYDKYLTIHVLIGRPEAAEAQIAGSEVSGSKSEEAQTASVPVQIYGRLKDSNSEPFNMVGPVTLARTDNEEMPWEIIDSALEPRGVVREEKSDSPDNSAGEKSTAVIPSRFQGKWAARAALCNSDTSELNMKIEPEKLNFWESQATVKSVEQNGQRITVTADYHGEGEAWTRTTSYTLSADGETLTSDDGTSRVKCK